MKWNLETQYQNYKIWGKVELIKKKIKDYQDWKIK